ncbi:DUF883 family protein [Pontibaca methylaminivorans]|uniref:DUF883 family protein n=1 Tax=Pontibaca methylaminivorans TaxID=515897 RepID=UPI002FD9E89E
MARSETSTSDSPSSEELAKQLEELRSDMNKLTKTMGDLGRASGARLGDAARENLDRAEQLAHSGMEAARARAQQLEHQASDFVAQQPAMALGIAAGLGFLVGLMTSRR